MDNDIPVVDDEVDNDIPLVDDEVGICIVVPDHEMYTYIPPVFDTLATTSSTSADTDLETTEGWSSEFESLSMHFPCKITSRVVKKAHLETSTFSST